MTCPPIAFVDLFTRNIQSFHAVMEQARRVPHARWRAVALGAALRPSALVDALLGGAAAPSFERCLQDFTGALGPGAWWGPQAWLRGRSERGALSDGTLAAVARRRPAEVMAEAELLDALDGLSEPPQASLGYVCGLMHRGRLGEARAAMAGLGGAERQEALGRLAVALHRGGDRAQAQAALRSLRHRDARALGQLGIALWEAQEGRLAEGLELLGPRTAPARATALLAWAAYERGQRSEALDALGGQAPLGRLFCERLPLRPRLVVWALQSAGAALPEAKLLLARAALDGGDLRAAQAALDQVRGAPVVPRRHGDEGLPWEWPGPGRRGLSLADTSALLSLSLAAKRGGCGELLRGWSKLMPVTAQRLAERPAAWRWLRRLGMGEEALRTARTDAALREAGSALVALQLRAEAEALAEALRASGGERTEDPLASAYLRGLLGQDWEELRRSGELGDAASVPRSLYDEAAAHGPERERRRTALVRASRAVLRRFCAGEEVPEQALHLRLRCLGVLGGEEAAEAIEEATRLLPERRGELGPLLLSQLGALSPPRAAAALFNRFEALTGGQAGLDKALGALEAWGALAPPVGRELRAMARQAPGQAWLGELLRALWARLGQEPPAPLLAMLRARSSASPSPSALLDSLDADRQKLLVLSPPALLARLRREPAALELLQARSEQDALEPGAPWSPARWAEALYRIDHDLGAVQPDEVARWAQRLSPRCGPELARTLLGGGAAVAMPRPLGLDAEGKFSLLLLDRRSDFRAFVRLADCVTCCYESTSRSYSIMRRHALALWKDPLSFAFQILRRDDHGRREAWGFVFGSFGVYQGQHGVALLNGVYLRRSSPSLCAAVLAAMEEHFCRPLGLRHIASGSRYNGYGPAPQGYHALARPVRRLRALAGYESGGIVSDDLRLNANEETSRPPRLYWRDLR